MVAIIITWILIFFVFISLGSCLVSVFSKISKSNESYNIVDIFLLGMCSLICFVSFTSLWFPSNQYILLLLTIFSLGYWMFDRSALSKLFKNILNLYSELSLTQKILLILSVVSVIVYVLFGSSLYDEMIYHRQQIKWNEFYPAIPGLSNLEDRFGFNSNHLLLLSIFSFRFLFDQGIFSVQALLYTLILCWALIGLFRSHYNGLNIALVFLFIPMLMACGSMLSCTSTDIIPALCIFYYIAKTTLDHEWLKNQPLLACLLPVTLVTFKLSTGLFCLVCIYVILMLIEEKHYKQIALIMFFSTAIIIFWCIRNIIISGYLVYPLYQLDFFSFDWKLPKATVVLEKIHIYEWAYVKFRTFYLGDFLLALHGKIKEIKLENVFLLLIFIISALSLFPAIAYLFRKKTDKAILTVYSVSALCIIFSFISAPDVRFFAGYCFGCALMLIYFLLHLSYHQNKPYPFVGKIIVCFTIACFWFVNMTKLKDFFVNPSEYVPLVYRPSVPNPELSYTIYDMKNFNIYLTKDIASDLFPAVITMGIPETPFIGEKIQSISSVEARGNDMRNGFRTKKEYLDVLNNNLEDYIRLYYKIKYKKDINRE